MADPLSSFSDQVRARIGSEADPWLKGLKSCIDGLVSRWELTDLGEPRVGDAVYTVPATRSGSEPVALKVSYPDGWFFEGIEALTHWDGRGVVRLIDHDPRGVLLLERATPGTSLLEEPDEETALGVAAEVLQTLWVTGPQEVTTVGTETLAWAASMPRRHDELGRPFDRTLLHQAILGIRELVPTQREAFLLHGDLHMGNVQPASRSPWLAVDPKPLVGERAFDAAALVRDRRDELPAEPDGGRARLARRLTFLSERLELDRERLRRWSLAIAVDYALADWEQGFPEEGRSLIHIAELLADR